MTPFGYEIGYGKHRVPVYRVYAAPLAGVTPIPESAFVGRSNELFACEVDVDVLGGETRRAPYLALNPNGRVPLLQLADAAPGRLTAGRRRLPSGRARFGDGHVAGPVSRQVPAVPVTDGRRGTR